MLDKSGKEMVQWPIVELEKLRTKHVKLPNIVLKGGSLHEVLGVTPVQVCMSLAFLFFFLFCFLLEMSF